jgi:hypothetical protein
LFIKKSNYLASAEFSLSELGLASVGIDGVKNNAVLTLGQGGNANLAKDLFIHSRNV